jgi:hypothetical protein
MLMAAAACLALAACDDGVSGTYAGNENSFLEKLEFNSDKVDVTGFGETKQGTYEIDGDKVMITIGGETQVFTRGDDDCLDGGLVLGKYCKE